MNKVITAKDITALLSEHWLKLRTDPLPYGLFPRCDLPNGYSVSIQGSDRAYSSPRVGLATLSPYTHVEVAIFEPNGDWFDARRLEGDLRDLPEYIPDDDGPVHTVYPYISWDDLVPLLVFVVNLPVAPERVYTHWRVDRCAYEGNNYCGGKVVVENAAVDMPYAEGVAMRRAYTDEIRDSPFECPECGGKMCQTWTVNKPWELLYKDEEDDDDA